MTVRPILVAMLAVVAFVATMTVACGSADSSYFMTEGTTAVSVPMTTQEPAWFGIETLIAQEGDRVRLEGVDPVGTRGNPVVDGLVVAQDGQTVGIGAMAESDIRESKIDLTPYKLIEGFEFRKENGPLTLMVRVTGTEPVMGFDSLRLRFRINGGRQQTQAFHVKAYVCVAPSLDAAGQTCDPLVAPSDRESAAP